VQAVRRASVIAAVAVVGGVALGALTLLVITTLPYPLADLGNSGAMWAGGAFAVGAWVCVAGWRAVAAGTVLLAVATESYYLAAMYRLNDDVQNLWTPATLLWLVLAVVVGSIFGTAGAWWRSGGPVAAVGWSVDRAGGVRGGGGRQVVAGGVGERGRRSLGAPIMMTVSAIVLPFVLGRDVPERLRGLAGMVALGLVGLGCFLAAGYGGVSG
jgi:hypothetical protein